MRFISDIHKQKQAQGKPVVSFEFFPPKTETGDTNLLEKTIPELLTLKPDVCSVTYGAGGGARGKTRSIVDRIQITVKQGAVSLVGAVDRASQVIEAQRVAQTTEGVTRVDSRLSVRTGSVPDN